jgi:single-strand DNA-binding protein
MAADNHTTIVGNLVDDPELRFTTTGIAVANMRVAVTQRIQQDGEWRDGDTSFLKVNVWRGQAEHLADSLAKGDRVMVTGRLRQRSWETPEGDKRSVTEIEADEVGASLKWATAKVERTSERGNGDRTQGRERQAERSGGFNDAPPSEHQPTPRRPRANRGRRAVDGREMADAGAPWPRRYTCRSPLTPAGSSGHTPRRRIHGTTTWH